MERVFIELGFGIFISTVFGIIAKLLKQPLIIAFIVAGFVVAPFLFSGESSKDIISLFSNIGIAFLLFIVGMELKTDKIKEVGKKIMAIGLIQVLVTAFLGYIVALLLGFDSTVSLYIGMILSFSSTVIVINLLSEKKALSVLYGKIVVGILVLQDVFALLLLVFLSGLKDGQGSSVLPVMAMFAKGFLAFTLVYIFSQFVIKKAFRYLARSQDLLFLSSIAWCFAIAGVASLLGFSIEMGAFLAGFSLANLPYSEEISLKLSSLRDFFLILFFVALGMQTNFTGMQDMVWPIVVFVLFVIIVKTLVVLISMSYFGFTKRTSFYTGISLSQVSEFSLIVASIAYSLGYIGNDVVSMIVIVTVITILTSSYLITFLGYIYSALQKQLRFFENENIKEQESIPQYKNHIVLFGYHRLGRQIFNSLEAISKKIIVVDFNPEVVDDLNCQGKACVYGDAYDAELLERLNLKKAKMVVVTFPGFKSNLFLIKKVKSINKKAKIITMAEEIEHALELYNQGANYVILPHYLSGEHVSEILSDVRHNKKSLVGLKKNHISNLKGML